MQYNFQLVTANEKLEKELGKTNSSKTETKHVDQGNLIDEISGLKEKLKLYEEEEEKSDKKISDLEEELSLLRKHELDQITDEFSMG